MCDVERVIDIYVSVGVAQQIVKDVLLQRIRRFHDEGIEVQPPEPDDGMVSLISRMINMELLPFGLGIFSHAIPYGVYLLPALSPFMCIPLLSTHIHNLEIVAPLLGVLLLISHTVSFDRPFARAFPFHDTPSLISC